LIKTRIGHVSGTRQSPSVAITVFESTGAALGYDAAFAAALAVAPATIFGATLDTNNASVLDQSLHTITFELEYTRNVTLTLTRSIDAQTESKKLHNFIAPVGVFDSGGDVSSSYGNLQWKLERQGSAAEFNSGKPTVVDPLRASRSLSYTTNQTFINDTYLDTIEDMVERGVFNSTEFLGRPIGSLQLVGFSADEGVTGDWSIGYSFGYKKAQTSVDIGDGVTIPTIRGCDTYWPIEVETYSSDSIQPKVKAAVVGQAWPLEDFSVLNLPWQGTLTTRTSSTAGIITTLYEHDITASDDVAVYWDGGRAVADVTGTTTFTLTFSSGTGDALPPAGTNLLVAKV
jgi:hypothetical protein